MEEETIKIRDLRKKQFFMVDDEYLNGYARLCGIIATGVYIALCRHVNKTQRCWPSLNLIAEKLGINEKSVRRSIKILKEWNIIKTKRMRDDTTKKWKVTVYQLVDKSEWKPKPPDSQSSGSDPEPPDSQSTEPPDSQSTEGNTVIEGNTVVANATFAKSKSPNKKPMNEITYEYEPEFQKRKPKKRGNDLARLIRHYFTLKGHDLSKETLPASPHLKAAKELIEISGGLSHAKRKLELLKEKAEKDWKGKDWTISTALKHYATLKEEELDPELYV